MTMAPRVVFYFTTLFLLNMIETQLLFKKSVCNTDSCINLNPPPSLHIACKAAYCELQCSTANACNNILYTCGDIDDYDILHANETSTCTINCLSANSCGNLTVVSNSGETQINCHTPDSCINSNFVCNPSSQINALSIIETQCNLDCTMQSCRHVNYLCTGYVSTCSAQCSDAESCRSLDMTCDQHLTPRTNSMQCDLFCGASCDAQSKFSCTKSSNAQCECTGNCNALLKYGVDTISPTMLPTRSQLLMPTNPPSTAEAQSLSHTFNVIDVEVYAVFTILWLLLFAASLLLCWRLQVTLAFFRSIRTVVLLFMTFVFEIFYYWIFCFVLWVNAIAYSIESSIHFYVWSCYLPIMFHISLLFSLCAYYNKHFHRDSFLKLFVCYGEKKRKIPKILKQFNFGLLLFFLITMVCVIAAHSNGSLAASIVFIAMFGLFGLLMGVAQFIVCLMDLKNMHIYQQMEERVLIIFVSISAMLFIIIFAVNLTIAFEWNAAESTQNIEGIRITQLVFELLMLMAMLCMIFYIYYDYIMGNEYEDEESQQSQQSVERTNTLTDEQKHDLHDLPPPYPYMQHVQIGNDSMEHNQIQQRQRSASTVFNDPSDDEMEQVAVRITHRSVASKSKTTEMASFTDKLMGDKNYKYKPGDAVDVAPMHTNEWMGGIVLDVMQNNEIKIRILDGPSIHKEIFLNLATDADKIRLTMARKPARPSIEVALAKQGKLRKAKGRKLPELPLFGAPLFQQKLVNEVPFALVLLKEYLFKFNGDRHLGIFVNGDINNINKAPQFMDGIVSKVDVNGVKKLIENNKISQHEFKIDKRGDGDERHYAMIFSELIKLWMSSLPRPLLQNMTGTFFAHISNMRLLQIECEKIDEPNWSTLVFIWDICGEIALHSQINKMTVKRLSQVFAPYLFTDNNKDRDAQLRPYVVNFCQIGINWRMQAS